MRKARRKSPHRTKIRALQALVAVVAVFDVFIWHNVLTTEAPVRIAQELPRASPRTEIAYVEPAPDVPGSVGVPVRIRIPSIALDAAVEGVTLSPDGSMDVPKRPLDTGWFALGPRPGETGSAAIAGHVDWVDGARAVFADLHMVKTGDTITVQDDAGTVTSFVVRGSRKYDYAADALDVFSSNDGKAHLNIITCAGKWDTRSNQYSERLVVFTDKETE